MQAQKARKTDRGVMEMLVVMIDDRKLVDSINEWQSWCTHAVKIIIAMGLIRMYQGDVAILRSHSSCGHLKFVLMLHHDDSCPNGA